jgi:hypothetical protein
VSDAGATFEAAGDATFVVVVVADFDVFEDSESIISEYGAGEVECEEV